MEFNFEQRVVNRQMSSTGISIYTRFWQLGARTSTKRTFNPALRPVSGSASSHCPDTMRGRTINARLYSFPSSPFAVLTLSLSIREQCTGEWELESCWPSDTSFFFVLELVFVSISLKIKAYHTWETRDQLYNSCREKRLRLYIFITNDASQLCQAVKFVVTVL